MNYIDFLPFSIVDKVGFRRFFDPLSDQSWEINNSFKNASLIVNNQE